MGGGGQEGAREWNQKWCRLLDTLQLREDDDNKKRKRGARIDLTYFLLTGVPLSATLTENLEHGSQTTERVRHFSYSTYTRLTNAYTELQEVAYCCVRSSFAAQAFGGNGSTQPTAPDCCSVGPARVGGDVGSIAKVVSS